MQDLFGTPYTDKIAHRGTLPLAQLRRGEGRPRTERKRELDVLRGCFSKHRGKFLQVHVTVEDKGVFTSPFYRDADLCASANPLGEAVCAENPHEYYNNKDPTCLRRQAGFLIGANLAEDNL